MCIMDHSLALVMPKMTCNLCKAIEVREGVEGGVGERLREGVGGEMCFGCRTKK